jgi:hypothetical protein
MFKSYLHNWANNLPSSNKHSLVDVLFEYKNDNEHFTTYQRKFIYGLQLASSINQVKPDVGQITKLYNQIYNLTCVPNRSKLNFSKKNKCGQ